MIDGVQIIIDKATYRNLVAIANKKQNSVVEELSQLIKKHIQEESTKKINESVDCKSYLCEG